MAGHTVPTILDDSPVVIQSNLPVHNLSEEALPIVGAHRDEIGARILIIVIP
jgi:hypothetical protein